MKLWTQYPINPGTQQGAVYAVDVLAWDGNKWCFARWNGRAYVFKLWYCHVEPECVSKIWEDEELLAKLPGKVEFLTLVEKEI